MARRNQSVSPASSVGQETLASVSPASTLGLEETSTVTLRSGRFSGGGQSFPSSGSAVAAEAARRAAEQARLAQEAADRQAAQRVAEQARQKLIRESTATARSPDFDLVPFQEAARRKRKASRVKPGSVAERRLEEKGISVPPSTLLAFEAGLAGFRSETLKTESERLGQGLTRLQTERLFAGRTGGAVAGPSRPKVSPSTAELTTIEAELLQTPAPQQALTTRQSIIGTARQKAKDITERLKRRFDPTGFDIAEEESKIVSGLQTSVPEFNRRVKSFNDRFGSSSLSSTEFERAAIRSAELETEGQFLQSQQARLDQLEQQRLGRTRGPVVSFLKKKRFDTRAFDTEQDRVVIAEKDVISIADILTAPAVGVQKIGEGIGALAERIILEEEIPAGEKTKGRKIIETAFDIGSFVVPQVAIARLGTKAVTGTATAFDPTEEFDIRAIEGLEAGLSVGLLGAGAALRARRLAKEPLVVKAPRPEVQSFSETLDINIRQGGKAGQLAQVIVESARPARQAFVAPSRRVGGAILDEKQLAKLSFGELKSLFPKGSIRDIENAAFAASVSEPFLVSSGLIARPLRKGGRIVELASAKGTTKRIEPTIISRLEGRSDPLVRELNRIDPTKLDKFTRRSLQELQKTTGLPKGFDITKELKAFPKGTKLGTGDIVTTDLFKITKSKGLERIKPGRRVRRGKITSIQRPVARTEFDREFGLKARELLVEELGILDTTFPRTAIPKKVSILKGRVRRFEFEVPELTREQVGTKIVGKRRGRTAQKLRDLELVQIQQQTGAAAFRTAGRLKARSPSIKQILSREGITELSPRELPTIVGGAGALKGEFAGLGTFELTDEVSGFLTRPQKRSAVRSNLVARSNNLERDLLRSNFELSTLTRTRNKTQQKNLSKNLNKSISKNLSKTLSKTQSIEKTLQKTLSKTLLKQLSKSAPRTLRGLDNLELFSIPKRPKIKIPFALRQKQKKRKGDSNGVQKNKV